MTADGNPIGKVETTRGEVVVEHADGSRETLSPGDIILQGDAVQTGEDGSVSMVMADHSQFSLGNAGRMTMDEMVYDADAQEGSALVSVTEGVFVFVSGMIAKTSVDAMVIRTPAMTMGIRGTKLVGKAGPEGADNAVTLLEEADGHVGEITVFNDVGVQVLNRANQTLRVAGSDAEMQDPMIVTSTGVTDMYGAPPLLAPAESSLITWPRPHLDDTQAPEADAEESIPAQEESAMDQPDVLIDDNGGAFRFADAAEFGGALSFADSHIFPDEEIVRQRNDGDVVRLDSGKNEATALQPLPRVGFQSAVVDHASRLADHVDATVTGYELPRNTASTEPDDNADGPETTTTDPVAEEQQSTRETDVVMEPVFKPSHGDHDGGVHVRLELIADAWRQDAPNIDPAMPPEEWLLQLIDSGSLDFGDHNPAGEDDARVLFAAAKIAAHVEDVDAEPVPEAGYTTVADTNDPETSAAQLALL